MCYTPNDVDPYGHPTILRTPQNWCPHYYSNDEETGDPPHGYWLKSPDWELMKRYERECHQAVEQGIACWIDENDLYPF